MTGGPALLQVHTFLLLELDRDRTGRQKSFGKRIFSMTGRTSIVMIWDLDGRGKGRDGDFERF